MIQTILFATDLCVFTPYLLKHVTDLAQRWGARVVVVHAVEPLGSLGTAVVNAYLPDQISRQFEEQGLDALLVSIKDRLIELLADEVLSENDDFGVINDVVVEIGKPEEIILGLIQTLGADLVVMGSHAPDRFGPSTLGSVVTKVMNQSKIPVFLIPVSPMSPADIQRPPRAAGH